MRFFAAVLVACAGCATVGTHSVEVPASPPVEKTPEAVWTPGPLFWGGVGTAGAGAASVVVSAVFAGKVKDTEAEATALRDDFDGLAGPDDPVCTELGDAGVCASGPLADLDERGDRESTIRMVTLIGGVGLIVVGVVLGTIDSSAPSVTVAPLPGGGALVLEGCF